MKSYKSKRVLEDKIGAVKEFNIIHTAVLKSFYTVEKLRPESFVYFSLIR